jgi:NMD protein affecting ribosome stability and mRNA decay
MVSEDEPMFCASCGRELDGDPDESLTGNAGDPMCGACARESDFFVLDIAHGELDGDIDE